jgi:hypothetical protein
MIDKAGRDERKTDFNRPAPLRELPQKPSAADSPKEKVVKRAISFVGTVGGVWEKTVSLVYNLSEMK